MLVEQVTQKYLEIFAGFFIDFVIPLSAYVAIGVALSLLAATFAKRSLRTKDTAAYQRWQNVKSDTESKIVTLPNRQMLEQEFLLHTIHLSETETVKYQNKFEQIVEEFDVVLSRYATELEKPDITSDSKAHITIQRTDSYKAMASVIRINQSNLAALWNEIADPSLSVSQSVPVKKAVEQSSTATPQRPTTTQKGLGHPLIEEDTFWGDVVNALYLRPPYRKPFKDD